MAEYGWWLKPIIVQGDTTFSKELSTYLIKKAKKMF